MVLHPDKIKKYLEFPFCCPYCNSENIQSVSPLDLDLNISTVKELIHCSMCRKMWYDVYQLANIEETK